MSGPNTKSNKVDRALRRIGEIQDQSATIEQLSNSLYLSTEVNHRLEAENARLRKYLGSVLFERRQQISRDVNYLRALARIASRAQGIPPAAREILTRMADYQSPTGEAQIPTLGDPLDLNPAHVPSRLPNVKMEI